MPNRLTGEKAKQADVPVEFCKAKCCAWRGNQCQQITAGPGGCLWPKTEVEKAIKQGIGRKR